MSKSYRTELPRLIAARNFRRDREGLPLLPRVIERSPRPGDIHPLSASVLHTLLERMPVSYLHGIRHIELRPRRGRIGKPLGTYFVREKAIVLYSVPATEWRVPTFETANEIFERYGAIVRRESEGSIIRWTHPEHLACFLYEDVFLHELGHHKDYQYRCRKKLPPCRRIHEYSANRHAFRLARWRSYESILGPPEGEPLPGGA